MKSKTHGYIFTLLAITIFSLQDAISKHLGGVYPPVFVTMIRYWAFAGFCVILAMKMPGGLKAAVRTTRPFLQIARGVLLSVQVVIAITSFAIAGLAHSQAVFAATPILVALLSIPLLGERVGWRRWTAIGAGLFGVLLILKPAGGFIEPTLLLAVSGSVIWALYIIATRLVSHSDPPMTSFFYTGVFGALTVSLIGPFFWASLAGWDRGWMALLCITSIASHYLLIRAYDILDASAVQPLTYLNLVYASIIGITVFGEALTWNIIAGSLVVVAAGIFTLWREYVLRGAGARLPLAGRASP